MARREGKRQNVKGKRKNSERRRWSLRSGRRLDVNANEYVGRRLGARERRPDCAGEYLLGQPGDCIGAPNETKRMLESSRRVSSSLASHLASHSRKIKKRGLVLKKRPLPAKRGHDSRGGELTSRKNTTRPAKSRHGTTSWLACSPNVSSEKQDEVSQDAAKVGQNRTRRWCWKRGAKSEAGRNLWGRGQIRTNSDRTGDERVRISPKATERRGLRWPLAPRGILFSEK
jgi:hypothetical protein